MGLRLRVDIAGVWRPPLQPAGRPALQIYIAFRHQAVGSSRK